MLFLLTACTKDIEMGQQNVNTSSLAWLPQSGQTNQFKSAAITNSLTLFTNNQKSNFISSPDCDKHFPKETCYHYQMQQVFITSNTADNAFSVTYSIIRSIKDGQFYDQLQVSMFEDEKTFANLSLITWAANPTQIDDASGYSALYDSIELGGKTFQNVYHKMDIGGDLYVNQDKGVVAFQTGDGKLWVLQ